MNIKSIFLVSTLVLASAAQAQLAYWNFNDAPASPSTGNSAALFSVDKSYPHVASAVITSNFASADILNLPGSSLYGMTGEAAGQSLAFQGGGTGEGPNYVSAENGHYYQIELTAEKGYELQLYSLAFEFQKNSTGFNAWDLLYSVDGRSFTNMGGPLDLYPATAFNLYYQSFYSTIRAPKIYIRTVLRDATAPDGYIRFDSMGVGGIAYKPVPEPGTFAALGLGAAAMLRRRRKA